MNENDPKPETPAPHGSVAIIQDLAKQSTETAIVPAPPVTMAETLVDPHNPGPGSAHTGATIAGCPECARLGRKPPEEPEVHTDEDGDVTVIARNRKEMDIANKSLIAWADRKLAALQTEKSEHEANFKLAKRRKIKSDAYQALATKTQKKIEYYEKIREALAAGYCIVPSMPIDVIAIRTTKKKPKANHSESVSQKDGYVSTPNVPNQKTNSPPAGEGKYVQPAAILREGRREFVSQKSGKEMIEISRWASNFQDEIDFPFKLAKPAILNATANALAEKVFDEIGVLPTRPGSDPMVIGRIKRSTGAYQFESVDFVIVWFIDTKDL